MVKTVRVVACKDVMEGRQKALGYSAQKRPDAARIRDGNPQNRAVDVNGSQPKARCDPHANLSMGC